MLGFEPEPPEAPETRDTRRPRSSLQPPARSLPGLVPWLEARAAPRPQVELVDVGKEVGCGSSARVVLAHLELELEAGRTLLIRGQSGSGKTTLLGLLGCLVWPTSGRVRVGGREVTREPEALAELRRCWFGFVFQDHHLVQGATALANVVLPALPRRDVDGELPTLGRNLLARFGLADRAGERIERLSGGERQRVATARALVNDPRVLLADEPTAHLDRDATFGFLDLVVDLAARGRAVVVASHDPELAASRCFDRVMTLSDGRLWLADSPFRRRTVVPCS